MNKIDADINALAALTPDHFKMRVRSTQHAKVYAVTAGGLTSGFIMFFSFVPIAITTEAVGVMLMIGMFLGGFILVICMLVLAMEDSKATLPLPWRRTVTIYTQGQGLTCLEDQKHIPKTYSELVAEHGIILNSLLAELDRGITVQNHLVDRLSADQDTVARHRDKVEEHLDAMSELEQVQSNTGKTYPFPTLRRNHA